MLSVIGLIAIWTAALLSPSLSFPTTIATDTTGDTSFKTPTTIIPSDSSTISDSTTTTTTVAPCVTGDVNVGRRAVSFCSLRKKTTELQELYENNGYGSADPTTNDATLRSLLTAPVRCRADMHTRLSYYHHLLTKLSNFYDQRGGPAVQAYQTPTKDVISQVENLKEVMKAKCEDDPANNCSALSASPSSPYAITSVGFQNGTVDDAHEWGSSLTSLLLARLESLAPEDGTPLCSRRRRRRRGKDGKRARRSRKMRKQIQNEIENAISNDLPQISDDAEEDLSENDNALSSADSENKEEENDNINGVIAKEIPHNKGAIIISAISPAASRKTDARKDGMKKRNKRKNRRKGRKNRRRGRKNRGKGRKNRGKGRKNKKGNRQRRRDQRNKRRRGGQNRRRKSSQ